MELIDMRLAMLVIVILIGGLLLSLPSFLFNYGDYLVVFMLVIVVGFLKFMKIKK